MLLVLPARSPSDDDSSSSLDMRPANHPRPGRGRGIRPGGRSGYAARAIAPTNQIRAGSATSLRYFCQRAAGPWDGNSPEAEPEKILVAARPRSSSIDLL